MSHWLKTVIVTGAMAATAAATLSAEAAETFIKFDGIKGDSNNKIHKGEVSVLSWSWGTSSPVAAARTGGGAGAAKPNVTDITLTKQVDSATVLLLKSQLAGKAIPVVVLSVDYGGAPGGKFIEIKLTDVYVSGVQFNGAPGAEVPIETVTLNFASIEYSVTPREPTGKALPPIVTKYNVKTAKVE